MKFKYEQLEKLLKKLDDYAGDVSSYEYGLPLGYDNHNENMVKIITDFLDIGIDEDPKISVIIKHTGCTRQQATDLINSGEL